MGFEMARLVMVRHGEPAGAYGVAADPGLSPTGAAQAGAIANVLLAEDFAAVLCSPLQRCRETAAPFVAACGLSCVIAPEVAEVETPPDISDRRSWLTRAFPTIASPAAEPTLWSAIGLRTWRDRLIQRLRAQTEDTVVFSHFIAINAAVSFAMAREETIVCWPGHCEVARFTVEGGALRLVEAPSSAGALAT
jgi:broad specificity phosphatase PhoE